MTRDLSRFVGIPYLDKGTDPARGLDCWQLVRHFYAHELSVELPHYMTLYTSSLDGADVWKAITSAIPDWLPVPAQRFGDVLIFRIAKGPWHTAVALDDGQMLHTDQGHGSVIEPQNSLRWRDRFYGCYRWKL